MSLNDVVQIIENSFKKFGTHKMYNALFGQYELEWVHTRGGGGGHSHIKVECMLVRAP